MKCAVFSALIASAAAFAPVEQGFRSTTHLNSDAAADEPASSEFCRGYVGNTGPEPILFFPGYSTVDFDPLGFTTVRGQTVVNFTRFGTFTYLLLTFFTFLCFFSSNITAHDVVLVIRSIHRPNQTISTTIEMPRMGSMVP